MSPKTENVDKMNSLASNMYAMLDYNFIEILESMEMGWRKR
jgi:hypothetical protein